MDLALVAQQASPDRLVPVITASATVVAAIIGGLVAATFKHRWDVKDDERRWDRERDERRREELKAAFTEYLSTRSEVVDSLTHPVIEEADLNKTAMAVYKLVREEARLTILLGENNAHVVKVDCSTFAKWIEAMFDRGNDRSTPIPVAPGEEAVQQLAHRLLNS